MNSEAIPDAVIMPNWIGDFLMALSVVEQRRSAGNPCVMIIPSQFESICRLLSDCPYIPSARKGISGYVTSLAMVRKRRFKTLYILPHSLSSAVFGWLCGIKRRRGIKRDHREYFLSDVLPRKTRTSKQHITLEYATVLETAPVPFALWKGVRCTPDERGSGAIVMCPGAHYGPAKRWPHFKELAQKLHTEKIVLLGTPNEALSAQEVMEVDPLRIVNLVGKTSVVEAIQIIAAAKLVIANDSGLMHAAGYVGTPVIGIFGSTQPVWTTPLGAHTKIAYVHASCSPCFRPECKFGHYNCLKNVTVEMVAGLTS